MKRNATILSILFLLLILSLLAGCASTARMIDSASLQTSVTMQDSIFLKPAEERTAFVKVLNTSEVQNVPLEAELKQRLAGKDIKILNTPSNVNWIIELNLKSLTCNKLDSMSRDLSRYGTIAGGVAGAIIPGGGRDSWLGAAVGGIVGNVAGAVAGSFVKLEAYDGVIDLRIRERIKDGVKEKATANTQQGRSTIVSTVRDTESDYQTYRTSLAIRAKRTNINLEEAISEIAKKVADQIAGLF